MATRVLPHSTEVENQLLGSYIVNPDTIVDTLPELKTEDFYSVNNQKVFDAISHMFFEDHKVDIVTLSETLKRRGDLEKIGGESYLADLVSSVPLVPNNKEYAQIIKDNALTRALIKTAEEIHESAYREHDDVNELIEHAEGMIFNLSHDNKGQDDLVPIKEVVFDTLARIQEIHENKGKLTGTATGFTDLDRMTSGFQKADLVIIAARPSMGKTALALNIATNAAIRENKSVLIFSLEMSKEQLVQRMILSEALVDSNRIRTGNINSAEDWGPITVSAEDLCKTKIFISDTPGINLAQMRSICRKQALKEPIDLIVIDYMQLMSGTGRAENRQHEISEISRGLKQIAREMNCPVICLSQLARGPESRLDKRPLLSDLRDSGSIEQDADVVLFLYRDAYYNKEDADPYEAELHIAKQRNGPTGKIFLRWLADYTRFVEPSEMEDIDE